jgi:hypothetical protein
MTYRLADEIRAELTASEGAPGLRVSGDFWPPQSSDTMHKDFAHSRKGPEHGHRDQRRIG